MKLPIVFIDSWAKKPQYENDTTQQSHFEAETQKLWSFGNNTSSFKFKTIDEVLEENAQYEEEIDTLSQSMMPVGSIIAWVPYVEGSQGNDVSLPEGWMECNGDEILVGKWKGKTTPKLNNDKHFLRGD